MRPDQLDSKKRILILSYHFPPLNVIASYRAKAYADHFSSFGIYPVVITHNWGHPEKDTEEIAKSESGEVIRLPMPSDLRNTGNTIPSTSTFRKISIFFRWVQGFLDDAPGQMDSYTAYKNFLSEYLKKNDIDIILSIYSPHHHLKLSYELHRNLKLPYILDFRDLWNNRVMTDTYAPGLVERLKNTLMIMYWSVWLNHAKFYTTVSQPWLEKIGDITDTQGYKVMHGYDSEIENRNDVFSNGKFLILYAGSTSETQDIEGLAEILKMFLDKAESKHVQIVFLGSGRNDKAFLNPGSLLAKHLNKEDFEVTKRVSRSEVLTYFEKASILLMPTYRGLVGTYSGKLFEYLGVKKNILAYPRDHGVIDELLQETQAGKSFDSKSEAVEFLYQKYQEWRLEGSCNFHGDLETLQRYSRKYQVGVMAELIKKNLMKGQK